MQYTHEEIAESVQTIIAETLRISPGEVQRDSVLGEELCASSLDFVDIQFRLETKFKIKFFEGSIIEKLSEVFGEGAISINGHLTELGAEVLHKRMPEIESSKIYAGMSLSGIEDLFTTATWIRAVKELLDGRPQTCTNCDSVNLKSVRPSILICEECRKEIVCPTQEESITSWAEKISKF